MSDVLGGRTITLGSGTLGFVTVDQIIVEKITVTWSGASAGNVKLESIKGPDDRAADQLILEAKTLALASGNIGTLTQEFWYGGVPFKGLTKTAMTGVSGETGVYILVK